MPNVTMLEAQNLIQSLDMKYSLYEKALSDYLNGRTVTISYANSSTPGSDLVPQPVLEERKEEFSQGRKVDLAYVESLWDKLTSINRERNRLSIAMERFRATQTFEI